MLAKRIIPCLDIKNGRTVKGVNFENLRDAGDAVELAKHYAATGADELVFLDITATHEGRQPFAALVTRIAQNINIPFTVGGGISSVENVDLLLKAGADKVTVNSAAVKNPQLIKHLADKFGAQCVVLAVDANYVDGKWKVYTGGGRHETDKELYSWCAQAVSLGAGEILFTSMAHDGTKNGFALEALNRLSNELNVPVIASGGAGTKAHFSTLFNETRVDAALAASIFHFGEIDIAELKNYLHEKHIPVRLPWAN
ncbi:MAG TPA: imidazole glycerol phosphate synthase subunit HisF [Flavobacteriales bacterium]|nr:imidazole glycerol phosphate synthase subunit HisF [Flavobacteriales bacterium]